MIQWGRLDGMFEFKCSDEFCNRWNLGRLTNGMIAHKIW